LIKERYEIETIEQLRAISDMLRVRIVAVLAKRPMTVTQLGEELGLAPAKVHYHVRELEKVGLLELVETREKGGILEKYYQPIARSIHVNDALMLAVPEDEAQAMLRGLLDQISDDYLRAFRHIADQQSSLMEKGVNISLANLYLTPEEQRKLIGQFHELSRPFEAPRGVEGEKEITFSLLAYPVLEQKEEKQPAKISNVWVVGATGFTRKDLLKTRAEGRLLRVRLIGVCQFTDDVTAELVDEVVESFSIVGKLVASPEVKEALKKKKAQE
jgi:DNA-binding transcriptional ArsR family regulator